MSPQKHGQANLEKLREEWLKEFQPPEKIYIDRHEGVLSCPLCGIKAEVIADWWLSKIKELMAEAGRGRKKI